MRSNPGLSGLPGTLIDTVKVALPVALSLYLSRIVASQLAPKIPGLDKLGKASKPVVAAVTVLGAHFATRSGPLSKYRAGVLMGTGINLIDSLISAFAPTNITTMFGLSDSGVYDDALSDYYNPGGELSDYAQDDSLSGLDDDLDMGDEVGGNLGGRFGGSLDEGSMDEGTQLYTGVFARSQ